MVNIQGFYGYIKTQIHILTTQIAIYIYKVHLRGLHFYLETL